MAHPRRRAQRSTVLISRARDAMSVAGMRIAQLEASVARDP
jgi:hypothetical protein